MAVSVKIEGADALIKKLNNMGPRARAVGRRSMAATSKELVKSFRVAADNAGFKKTTGATKRSIGITRLKDNSYIVGVRHQYQDKRTGKIPNKYAGIVHVNNPWFIEDWKIIGPSIGKKIAKNLAEQIAKEAAK